MSIRNEPFVVTQNGKILIIIRNTGFAQVPEILDWYAERYGFPREELGGYWVSDAVDFSEDASNAKFRDDYWTDHDAELIKYWRDYMEKSHAEATSDAYNDNNTNHNAAIRSMMAEIFVEDLEKLQKRRKRH